MNLPEEIGKLLKQKSTEPHDYINPNFLQAVYEALETYYNIADDDVDKWITKMWSC